MEYFTLAVLQDKKIFKNESAAAVLLQNFRQKIKKSSAARI
jgi:hypothetical protein